MSFDQMIEEIVPPKPMLSRAEVAHVAGRTVKAMAAMADRREGPPFTNTGPRRIGYPRPGVVAWLKQGYRATSTNGDLTGA